MTPAQLHLEQFRGYEPEARELAEKYLYLLRKLPLSFVPLLLREVIAYDRKFPAERAELDQQFRYLVGLPDVEREKQLAPFRAIRVSEELQQLNWVGEPARFGEALSAYLWSTHQIDGFHAAAVAYMERANSAFPLRPPKMPRFVVVVVGLGVGESGFPLFRRLRAHGVHFTNVEAEGGLASIGSWLSRRAEHVPEPYAHWSVSGASSVALEQPGITSVSYESLAQPRAAMSAILRRSFEGGVGAEALRTRLAAMKPREIGLEAAAHPATSWFQLSLLSEGSGTQIFSTSFVQWAAREALRRAQPLTLVCRYTPRVRSSSMKDLLSPESAKTAALDPEGSLMDADMAAYQTWLNLQRLPGAADSVFVCWFEGHRQLLAIAPGLKAGSREDGTATFPELGTRLRIV